MSEIIPSIIKFPLHSVANARWPNGDKECVAWYSVITFDRNAAPSAPDNGFTVPITVKCWMGKSRSASVVYACIWVNGDGNYWSGKGQAGGYGYDKQSTAIAIAIKDAGIDIGYNFGGSGSMGTKNALENITRALGYTTFFVLGG
jgi:hypothetical protein